MDHCPNTQDNLNRHLEGAFTVKEEQALREHLTNCPYCAAAFKQIDLLEEVVRDAVMPENDVQGAAACVTERLAEQQANAAQACVTRRMVLGPLQQFIAAAALLLIGVGLGFAYHAYGQKSLARALKPVDIQVSKLSGTVLVKHRGARIWEVLDANALIYLGDRFHTTATSALELSLDQSNRIEVTQNSMLVLESHALYDPNTEFYLEHGQCTPVLKGPHGPFFISTPNGRMEALGTEFTVKVTE
jgi:ferric-dicitrate binding protein FerR (iron transport regulator)